MLLADTTVRSTVGPLVDLWLAFAAYWTLVTWHLVRQMHTWRVRAMLLAVSLGPVGYGVARAARHRERAGDLIELDDDLGDGSDGTGIAVDWRRL